jgi:Protein of unknown function (DUF2867)
MPKVHEREYYALQLRAQTILAGIPLHDVWAVDLPPTREPVTLDEFHPLEGSGQSGSRLTGISRALLRLRFFIGRIFHLEAEPRDAGKSSFAARLTSEDRARSSVEPGTSKGAFRVVYHFPNESMLEVQNRTVHGALVNALVETPTGYRYYLAVYVAKVSWVTPLYMALIDPFRRWLIYPPMLKNIRAAWVTSIDAQRAG